MDEAQIAQKLAQNITSQPSEPSAPTVLPSEPVNQTDQTGYANELPIDELTRYKIMDSFGVMPNYRDDPAIISKIDMVFNWAAEKTQSRDYFAVMQHIRAVESALGYNPTKARLDRLYEFVKLDLNRLRIEQEMQYV